MSSVFECYHVAVLVQDLGMRALPGMLRSPDVGASNSAQKVTILDKSAFGLGETHAFKQTCVSSRPNTRKSWNRSL